MQALSYSELFSYRIRDFILFTEEILADVYASFHEDLGPARFGCVVVSIFVLWFLYRTSQARFRVILGFAGLSWLVTSVFHLKYFITINWAAEYFGWVAMAQGILLLLAAIGFRFKEANSEVMRGVGALMFAFAAFMPWSYGSLFGWGPDATALGTLGLLFAIPVSSRWLLMLIPMVMLLISALMHSGMRAVG